MRPMMQTSLMRLKPFDAIEVEANKANKADEADKPNKANEAKADEANKAIAVIIAK
jgi:hypothetical protein